MKDSLLMYAAFENLGIPLDISRASMWSENDRYSSPPIFRFKFVSKDDKIYIKLMKVIDDFSGNLKWLVFTRQDATNFIMMPKVFHDLLSDTGSFDKNKIIDKMGELEYRRFIDLSIFDVIEIAKIISRLKI